MGQLRQVAGPTGTCDDVTGCPKVFIDEERQLVVIQGRNASLAAVAEVYPIGSDESLVEIPLDMWRGR